LGTGGTSATGGTTSGTGGAGGSTTAGAGGRTTAGAGGRTTAGAGGGTTAGAGGDATGGTQSPGGNTSAASGGSPGDGGSGGRASATGGNNATGGATGGASGRGETGGVAGGESAGGAAGGTASGGATSGGAGGGTGGNGSGGAAGGSGGATASGGTSGGGTSGGGTSGNPTGGADGGPFTLAWQDDFDTLDTSLWQAQSFTWDGNQAQFTPQNVSATNGKLNLSLTNAPSGSAKPYLGVELRSAKTLTYGKVSASMRFAKGSGVVSGLVLFYTPYPNCDWNEIDIEHLGNSSQTSQLNCQFYSGTPVSNCTTSVTPTQDPQVVSLGVDAEAAFHQYDIEWTPAGVGFFIDGTLLRTWTANISHLKLPMTILLTIWASNSASWAGALNASSAPTSAEVDWIKVYSWKG